jgi:hypothetical protein
LTPSLPASRPSAQAPSPAGPAAPTPPGPTFLGIGAQKCATSWLHDVLGGHPDIFTSVPKEIDFFTARYDHGYEWYRRHFAAGAGARARGEASPSYFYNPGVPERVRAFDPAIRVIVILRDPVDRAFSNHLHELRARHLSSERFEDGLLNNPLYLEQGRYATHLGRWLAVFPREAVLPLIFEEITAAPEQAVRQVYEFLGVDARGRFDASRRSSNESVAYRNEGVQAVLRRGGDALRRAGLGAGLERVKALPPLRRLMEMNKRDLRLSAPPPRPETRARLARELAPEMEALAAMLGRESLPWRSFPARGPA